MGGKITIDSATLMNKGNPTDGHSHHQSVFPPVFKGLSLPLTYAVGQPI
jgi:hypothetical protein